MYIRYDLSLKLDIMKNHLTQYDTLWSTGQWTPLILEMAFSLLSPCPFLCGVQITEVNTNWGVTIAYELNQIFLCVSLLRIYMLYNFIFCISKFMNPRSKRICDMNGCDANNWFAIKAIMKEQPYAFLGATIVLTVIIFGYMLRIFDGPLSDISGQDFNSINNTMWNVVITMTTTGYGDIYPKSNFGRLVGAFLCFWGTFLVSFFVVTINNVLTFMPGEEHAYTLLQRLHFKEQLKLHAINVLGSAFRQRFTRRHYPHDEDRNFAAMCRFRAKLLTFHQSVDQVRTFCDAQTEIDILMSHLEHLREDMDSMDGRQASVEDNLALVVTFIKNLSSNLERIPSPTATP